MTAQIASASTVLMSANHGHCCQYRMTRSMESRAALKGLITNTTKSSHDFPPTYGSAHWPHKVVVTIRCMLS